MARTVTFVFRKTPSGDGSRPVGEFIALKTGAQAANRGPNFYYVQVDDIPDTITKRRALEVLCEPWIDPEVGTVDPVDGTIRGKRYLAVRRWRIPPATLPAAARDELQRTGELTVSWSQFKSFMLNLAENRALSDGDF